MVRRATVFFIIWLGFISSGAAQTLTFPPLTGRVVDQAELLSATDRMRLTESLARLEAKTQVQLVVVTLKSLQGTSIEDYGYQLGRRWGIGRKDSKDKDTGVLLIVAPQDRAVRIEVGYGLEGTLTDAATKVVIEGAILPLFRVGDFPGGIMRGVEAIVVRLGGDADGQKSRAVRNDDPGVWPLIALGVPVAGVLILCVVTGGGALCQGILRMVFLMLMFGRGGSGRQNRPFSGGGGSFGGGGSSGRW